jgi:hypothetical protein
VCRREERLRAAAGPDVERALDRPPDSERRKRPGRVADPRDVVGRQRARLVVVCDQQPFPLDDGQRRAHTKAVIREQAQSHGMLDVQRSLGVSVRDGFTGQEELDQCPERLAPHEPPDRRKSVYALGGRVDAE